MTNISYINGQAPSIAQLNGEPNERVIAACEKLLEDAKSGALQAIIYAAVFNDESTLGTWAMGGTLHDGMKVLGRMSMLQHEFAQMLNDATVGD